MEENLQPQQELIKVLKEDAIIELKFGLNFYIRMGMILDTLLKDKTPEQILEAADILRNKRQHDEEWIVHYETMMYFIQAVEEYATSNKLYNNLTPEEYQEYLRTRLPAEEQEYQSKIQPNSDPIVMQDPMAADS